MMHRDFNQLKLTGWFPGHMLKAGRDIRERLQLIDAVVELLDARLPLSSRNPALEELLAFKPLLAVFNKTDLAAPELTARWRNWYRDQGMPVHFVDALSGHHVPGLLPAVRRLWEEERQRRGATRPLVRPLRILIAGIPNVGKSTLVNRLAARHKAAVGPKPGVTRQQQWIPLQDNMELLDTPGVLWPRIEDKITELKLGLAGTFKDDVIGEELLADYLWWFLKHSSSTVNWELYGLKGAPADPDDLLEAVGRRRGLLRQGDTVDNSRSAVALLIDFRAGRLGRFTLDSLPETA